MTLIPLLVVLPIAGALIGLGWDASSRALHPRPATYPWQHSDYPMLHSEDVVVESSTGARLTGRFFKGQTETTIVLLHGYGGNQDEMLPTANHLHEGGYSVFTYDQRGSGASTGEVTFGAREQDDLISVVDYLVSRPDVDREQLGALGFSMGGATTLLTAAREPRITAVVADSAWSDVRHWLRPSVGDVFLHPRDPFTALSLKLAELRTGIDLDDLRPAEVIDRVSPRPILLIHGGRDEIIVPAEAERNLAAAGEPKRLVLVPGAGHGDTIAPGEPSTEADVRAFFDRALDKSRTAVA